MAFIGGWSGEVVEMSEGRDEVGESAEAGGGGCLPLGGLGEMGVVGGGIG